MPRTDCASCGAEQGFKDLPLDYVATRWPGCDWTGDPIIRTQCRACGATFATVEIDESVREARD
jgi:hypothetical protein